MVIVIGTVDGGTVTITRRGRLVDMHLRDAEGSSVATVVRPASEVGRTLAGRGAARRRSNGQRE
ncbi:hypothetical protein [Kitasatospora sp. NPDC002040]|uniref:hypothetical protein n=1 Tax=Kitasatospora sp. NPDC002040 TaxID=3154661 RepID=UPI003328EB27